MNFLFRLFDIRQSETQAVGLLLLHAFFNGLGIALCFTAANLMFIQNFGAKALPGAYAISGGVLLISGFIYSKLEHSLSPTKLFRYVVVACAAFMILSWLGFSLFDPLYMAFALFVIYWVIYMLINLEFWVVVRCKAEQASVWLGRFRRNSR